MSFAHGMSLHGVLYLFTECSNLHSSCCTVKITLGTIGISYFALVSLWLNLLHVLHCSSVMKVFKVTLKNFPLLPGKSELG
jgi:hypothetical protein